MASGTNWQPGGVAAPTDWPDAGAVQWAEMTGIAPDDPLIGGYLGSTGVDPDVNRGARIVTLPPEEGGDGGVDAHAKHFDSWRDLFDFKGSPAPYVLLFTLAAIGLISGHVDFRAGPASGAAGLG